MSLFAHLSSLNDSSDASADALIRDAAIASLSAADRVGLAAAVPWSFAELAPSEGDYRWLCGWAATLTERTARRWLTCEWARVEAAGRRLSGPAVIGVTLLLFISETARRYASEHRLWPHVRRDEAGALRLPRADDELFVRGQPTQPHKEALEGAARQLNLRHTFDEADSQNYYTTVALQYGFSGPGFLRRLPDWLVSRECRPLAVERLLEPPLRSVGFRKLWDALGNYRRANITDSHLRDVLRQTSWVLPAWVEELIRRSTGRATVSESEFERPASSSTDDQPEEFLEAPRLVWGATPRFETRVTGIADLDLTEDTYDLLIGGRRVDSLLRQPNGSYSLSAERTYTLPANAPATVANLVVRRGSVAATQEIALWDADADVTVYRLSDGSRLPLGERISPNAGYVIRSASDLAMVPAPSEWYRCGNSTFWRLAPGWPLESALYSDGLAVWRPEAIGAIRHAVPSWAKLYAWVRSTTVQLGTEFSAVVEHAEDVLVRFVRTTSGPVEFAYLGAGQTSVGPLTIPASAARAALNLTIGLSRGRETSVVRQQLQVPVRGGARLTSNGWIAMNEATTILVEEARREPVRVQPPNGAILDGDIWIRQPSDRPKPVGECLGLGERLKWRSGAYDITASPIVLANEVIDRGLVRDVRHDEGNRLWKIELFEANEPDSEAHVAWWDCSGQYATWHPEFAQTSDTVWSFTVPESLTEPAVIAVARNGAWLGAWWQTEWPDILKIGSQLFGPRTTAQLVRWFRLPVLRRGAIEIVRQFALKNPVETLAAWLFDDAPTGLTWPIRAHGWLSAVAKVFRSWRPSEGEAEELVRSFASLSGSSLRDDEFPAPLKLGLQLARVDPLLMARIVRRLQTAAHEPLAGIIGYFLAPRVNSSDGNGFDSTLIDEAVRAFRGEQDASGNRKDDRSWAGQLAVRVAGSEPFRLQLAIRLLDSIAVSFRR